VAASAGFVVVQRFPGAVRRARIALALPLLREPRARWLQAIGRRVAPAPAAAGCAGACGGCERAASH